MSAGPATRVEVLRSAAAEAGLDAYLATSDESIAYLTGFRPLQLERLFAVVVRAGEGGGVVVPKLDAGQVAGAPAGLERVVYEASSDGLPELARLLDGARTVGVEEDHIVFARSRALAERGLDVTPAGGVLWALRARKDEAEIEQVRRACALVEEALTFAFAELRPGTVEQELNTRVAAFLRDRGASDAHSLVLFGENAANPHADPTSRELRAGDVVCADVSACLDGYWGDLTRCATSGPASEWARQAWELVREAQAAAIAACRPGRPAREVDLAQREILEARPDLGECLHGAGHAIGLALHEPPFLVPRIETPLEAGMIFTVEPGLYRAGVGGIRLEDDVVVRDGDARSCPRSRSTSSSCRCDSAVPPPKEALMKAMRFIDRRRRRLALVLAAAALVVVAMTAAAGAQTNRTAAGQGKVKALAFFGFAAANSFAQATWAGVQQTTKQAGVSAKFFDPNFNAQTQVSQIQDAITTGRYQAFVIQANDGNAVIPAIKQALKARISVVAEFTPVGSNYASTKPPISGMTFVGESPVHNGTELGALGIQACKGLNPCNVAYLEGFKSLPLDNARTNAVKKELATANNVKLVADVEGGYTQASG